MSEILLSELEYSGRLDSEYYQKCFLKYENIILRNNHSNLSDVANFLIGPFGSAFNTDNYLEKGEYRYIRGQDVKPFILKNSDNRYIPEADFNRLEKYALKENDVLVSVVGTLGNACLVQAENLPAIFSCKSTVIRTKKVSPIYILTYLNSKYGQSLLLRKERGAIQKGLNLDDLKTLLVPLFDKSFEKIIDDLFFRSQNGFNQAQKLYNEAETLLLENLGLTHFQAACKPVNIKSLKESFLQTGRLDAEFYQSKYDELENLFNRFERIKLADLVNYPISSGITPKAGGDDYADKENGIAFIRAVDLQNGEVSLANLNYIKPSIHETTLKRTQLKQNDVLLSIAGTVGRCAIFTHDMPANINQAVAILRFDESKVNRLYLVAFFNSELGKQFIAKYARQGLQTNLNLTEIGELSIPIPDMTIQIQIANYIQQSNDLREKATQLLAQAKSNVELEIENISLSINNLQDCGGGGKSC